MPRLSSARSWLGPGSWAVPSALAPGPSWSFTANKRLWAAQAIFKSPFWAKINNGSFLQLPALPTASNASRWAPTAHLEWIKHYLSPDKPPRACLRCSEIWMSGMQFLGYFWYVALFFAFFCHLQYLSLPLPFLQEWPDSAGIHWNPPEWDRNPPEWDWNRGRNANQFHRNATGIHWNRNELPYLGAPLT